MGLLCLDSRQMTIWFDFLKDELEKEEACFYFINQCRIFKTDQSYYFYQKNLQYLQDRVHSLTTKKLEYIYRRRFNFIFIFVTLAMNQLNLWTQLVPTKKKKVEYQHEGTSVWNLWNGFQNPKNIQRNISAPYMMQKV